MSWAYQRVIVVKPIHRDKHFMSPKPITRNTLFYGDNLPILRDHIANESIDIR